MKTTKLKLGNAIQTKTGLRAGQNDTVILNGTSTCPWCKKQQDYFDAHNIPYEFKDCDKGECRDRITGYPTLDNVVGYHEL